MEMRRRRKRKRDPLLTLFSVKDARQPTQLSQASVSFSVKGMMESHKSQLQDQKGLESKGNDRQAPHGCNCWPLQRQIDIQSLAFDLCICVHDPHVLCSKAQPCGDQKSLQDATASLHLCLNATSKNSRGCRLQQAWIQFLLCW